jgi:hypothetical protein
MVPGKVHLMENASACSVSKELAQFILSAGWDYGHRSTDIIAVSPVSVST